MSFKKVSQLTPLTNLSPDDQFLASYNGNSYKLSYDTLSADLKKIFGPTPNKNFIDSIFECDTEESELSDLTTLTEKTFNSEGDKFVYETNQLYKTDGISPIGTPINEYVLHPSKYPSVKIQLGTRWSPTTAPYGLLTVYSGENYIFMYRWAEDYNGNQGDVPSRASFEFISNRGKSSDAAGINSSRIYIGGSSSYIEATKYRRPFIVVPPNSIICPPLFSSDSTIEQTRTRFKYDSTNKITDTDGSVLTMLMTPSSGHDITTCIYVISEDMFYSLNIMF